MSSDGPPGRASYVRGGLTTFVIEAAVVVGFILAAWALALVLLVMV